jgi:hypothetical protein
MTTDLGKVISINKRKEILSILHNIHPGHNKRLWLVGFLEYVGYSKHEICRIISSENRWKGYDKDITEEQVVSVISRKERKRGTHNKKKVEPLTIEDLIRIFKSKTLPVGNMRIPSTTTRAAIFYYLEGYTPLPKDPEAKRPSGAWKIYQEKRPTIEEILSWDWSNGICLLADDKFSFLDIDTRGYEKEFPDSHKEVTPRGGLHVFGKGATNSVNVEGIGEIKGKGTLIVAYPTKGYAIRV